MDWFNFSEKMLGHLLSWPVLVLIALLLFRKPLGELIKNIKSYEGLGQKITFGEELAQLEQAAENLEVSSTASERIEAPTSGPRSEGDALGANEPAGEADERAAIDRFVMLAQQAPSAAVIDAWIKIEVALRRLAKIFRMQEDDRRPLSSAEIARRLVRENAIPQESLGQFDSFRRLRNDVAHGAHVPTPGEALAYADAAHSYWRFLEQVADEWEQRM
ncbi:hypothetical protein N5079_16810 [Planotetraspora sp. A-T 1434]|uniref:hypothetical protein n=1 Tax=Planotetraspora sp. A-T 1434 TaxID=2979219 RepID=UPI0021C0B070|nr:hypothetical protein [Planotetraspora sp. A-T 1434]MCT9931871.1 hypothetical protein [Planotetraspora sp. A-T 1434]